MLTHEQATLNVYREQLHQITFIGKSPTIESSLK